MKLTKQIFALAATAMLLTGCGGGNGGGQTGEKVDKNKFIQAAANLPAEHPYKTATVVNTFQRPGKQDAQYTATYTWNGYEWVFDEGYQVHGVFMGGSLRNYVSAIVEGAMEGKEFVSEEYYINPFSVKLVSKVDYGTGIKYEETIIDRWNDYGLTTYTESSVKYDDGLKVEKIEITYGGDVGPESQEISTSTSQSSGQVTPKELYDSFNFNHPYTSSRLTIKTDVTVSGQTQATTQYANYTYSDESGWSCVEPSEPYPSYTSFFAETFLAAAASGQMPYTLYCFRGGSTYKAVIEVSGASITISYNEYGLPIRIVQTQESDSYHVHIDLEAIYQ